MFGYYIINYYLAAEMGDLAFKTSVYMFFLANKNKGGCQYMNLQIYIVNIYDFSYVSCALVSVI